MDNRARTIQLNDEFRTTFRGGRVEVLSSHYELDARLRGRALCVMSRHTKFAPDSEHDCGSFVFAGYLFEWQIEYLQKDGTSVSRDPADSGSTLRVLTLSVVEDRL